MQAIVACMRKNYNTMTMKKSFIWMLAAMMICGLASVTMTSCTDNEDNSIVIPDPDPEPKPDPAPEWPAVIDYTQWMKNLNDGRLVADLSLPGAHDACTGEGWVEGYGLNILADAMAKCQDLTIQQLLEAGVRVFDLRPERVSKGDDTYELRCSHGPMTTNLLVVDFFRKLQKYLADNPTEFCLITAQLSATSGEEALKAWGEEFNALVRSDEFKGLFADFKPRLT